MTSEPLPLTLPTLDYLSQELKPRYARTLDGSYKLAWVPQSEMPHYVTAVASGQIAVLPDGETPATMAAADEVQAKMQRDAEAEMKRIEAADRAKQKAALEEQAARDKAALLAQHGFAA